MTANLTQHKVGGQEQDQNLVFIQRKQHVRLVTIHKRSHAPQAASQLTALAANLATNQPTTN